MVGIVRPFARYVRRCRRRALAMEPTEPIAIFDCFFFQPYFVSLASAGASRIESTRFEVIYYK